MWVSIAIIAGSLIVAQHDSQEACEGRKAMLLKEKSITSAQCVSIQSLTGFTATTTGIWCNRGNGTTGPCQ